MKYWLVLVLLLVPRPTVAGSLAEANTVVSNRYAKYFESTDWQYAAPDYHLDTQKDLGLPRERLMGAWYSWPRRHLGDEQARAWLRQQFNATLKYFETKPVKNFAASQGAFFLVRYIERAPHEFAQDSVASIGATLVQALDQAVSIEETANRAIVHAAHWQYVLDWLRNHDLISFDAAQSYASRLRAQLASAVSISISTNGWYREGRYFTLHYHIVSALNLYWYGQQTSQPHYQLLASRMYNHAKLLAFRGGVLEAAVGYRPSGVGVQISIMLATLGLAVDDPDAAVWLADVRSPRHRRDPTAPNRYVFGALDPKRFNGWNDDIAASDAIETSVVMLGPTLYFQELPGMSNFHSSLILYQDPEMRIRNTRTWLTVVDRVQKRTTIIHALSSTLTQVWKF